MFDRSFLALGASPLKTVIMVDGTHVVIDLRSHTEWYAFYSGRYDERETKLIGALLASDTGSFLDVGANIGLYAARIGRSVRATSRKVYAFEPVPANLKRLQLNIALNHLEDVVCAFGIALSDDAGVLKMVLREDFASGAETGNASVAISEDADGSFREVQVRCMPFDDARREFSIRPVSVVKVDIEGHEDLFMRGARQMLRTERPIILAEINPWFFEQRGVDLEKVLSAALPEGYGRYRFDERSVDRVVRFALFAEATGVYNAIFCPEERTGEFLAVARKALGV